MYMYLMHCIAGLQPETETELYHMHTYAFIVSTD